ncbi:MAG: hypothetical protein A3E85_02415 [Gammaproteobacteria bacterium RIFCSPHIGHO2_12_FULL_45_12]|nr:MAG: hypothetical protein A3E85_02415 [Gammaproteobacteria bacterium RIFCSPHIGHO2_12_FULL_45_12]
MSIIRLLLFHILISVRGIILGISRLFAFMLLGTWLCTLYIKEISEVPLAVKVIMFAFGIIFTFIYWFYDDLIFYFQPENKDITLYR